MEHGLQHAVSRRLLLVLSASNLDTINMQVRKCASLLPQAFVLYCNKNNNYFIAQLF